MPVSVHLDKGVCKAYENVTLDEVLAAPPSALEGLTERHDEALAQILGIRTVADLGSNKYFALAGVLVAMGTKQGDNERVGRTGGAASAASSNGSAS